VFNELVLKELVGFSAIGHVRYGTAGGSSRVNAQPLVSRYQKGSFALANNGCLVNVKQIRKELEEQGAIILDSNFDIIEEKDGMKASATITLLEEVGINRKIVDFQSPPVVE
jgi:glutamine phosphoribosylpyrophosphate amidotransferase